MGRRDNLLLVEGKDDLRVIPHLIEHAGVPWGPKNAEIVRIHEVDGFENLTTELAPQLKSAGLRRVGILVDANTDPAARWDSVRATISSECAAPRTLPATGFLEPRSKTGFRIGVWVMPDNASRGMMETFLLALRPTSNATLFSHAESSVDAAKTHGAGYSVAHRDKALIHTWLAWTDPPGRQLHEAIVERMLDPRGPYAAPFVTWFKALYEIP